VLGFMSQRILSSTNHISAFATVLSVAIPVGVFLGLINALYYDLTRQFDFLHV